MHRKKVTCELHDSYFSLMTIKHAIPKIEWAIELLYNSVKQEVSELETRELETRCGRESHHPAEGAFVTPDWVGNQRVSDKMWLEKSHHPAEGALGTPSEFGYQTSWWEDAGRSTCLREPGPQDPGWAAQANENDTRWCVT